MSNPIDPDTIKTHKLNTQILGGNYFLPVINIKINGKICTGLVDTGASISIIQRKTFDEIKTDPRIKKIHSPISVNAITGHELNISGAYQLPVNMGHKMLNHVFYVVDQDFCANYSLIIGFDFLEKYKLIVDFNEYVLKSNNLIVKIRDANAEPSTNNVQGSHAKLIRKCVLEPNQIKNVSVIIEGPVKQGDTISITSVLNNPDIKIQNEKVDVDEYKEAYLTLVNKSSERISLNKHTKIAGVSKPDCLRPMEDIRKRRIREFNPQNFQLNHLEPSQRNSLLNLLKEFADIFSDNLETIGLTDQISPNFSVDFSKIESKRAYPVPHALREELQTQLEKLLKADIIERSDSHIGHPVILVKKGTSCPNKPTYRIVQDYRATNAAIKFPKYQMPIANHLLEKLRGSKFFASLDLQSSFFQVPLEPKDRAITTFNTVFGNFAYKRLPQGLNFSPGVLQALTDKLVADIKNLNIANYIDDFCLGSDTFEEMLGKLKELFVRIRKFGLTVNPQKCIFGVREIKFLGHKLNANGITPTDENLRKIEDFPRPTTVRKTRRFLGLCGYYRRFLPNYSDITTPLTELTKKRNKFVWTEQEENAFVTLKDWLAKKPILTHPNYNKQFILSTDASDNAIAAMLGQKDSQGIIHPISYFSRKLNTTELKYSIMHKELLAIVESVKSYTHYLYGTKFIIRCDNSSLQTIKNLPNPANRVSRWLMFLAEFDYVFERISGAENFAADIFSRDFHSVNLVRHVPNLQEIIIEQKKDPKLVLLRNKIETKPEELTPSENNYFIRDDLIMHLGVIKRSIGCNEVEQIVIPDKLKPVILANGHNAHFGHVKTYDKIREKYFWENLYMDSKNYVDSCQECVGFKSPNRQQKVPIQRNLIPERPGQVVSIDFVGKLPRTAQNKQYIMVVIDHFTRYMKLYAMEDQTAINTADKLYEYITQFGRMEFLLTDCGTNFTAQLFKTTAEKLGIEKLYTTPYHPQTNGANEASHKALRKTISILARETLQWDKELPNFEMCYNNTIHSTTGEKPSFLLYGYDIDLPDDINADNKPKSDVINPYPEYIELRMQNLGKIKRIIRENILKSAENQENYQNRKAKLREFQIGQLVFLHQPHYDRNCHLPKKRNFKGVFRIREKHTPVNYSIQEIDNPRAKLMRVHSSRLIPYTSRNDNLIIREENPEHVEQTLPKQLPHAVFDEVDYIPLPIVSDNRRGANRLEKQDSPNTPTISENIQRDNGDRIDPGNKNIVSANRDTHTENQGNTPQSNKTPEVVETQNEEDNGENNTDPDKTNEPKPKRKRKRINENLPKRDFSLRPRKQSTVAEVHADDRGTRLFSRAKRITRPSEEEVREGQSSMLAFLGEKRIADKLKKD